MDKIENLTTPELIRFMNEKVKELVLITFKGLQRLNKEFEKVPDSYFVDNILKNFIGNMLLRGAEDALHFEQMGNHFLEEFKDFIQVAKEKLKQDGLLREVH